LSDLLLAIEDAAREEFHLQSADRDPLYLNIMVFDPDIRKLRVAAANVNREDKRWSLLLAYGDGLAGRAYKMNRFSLFVKARAVANKTPFYHIPLTGGPVSDDGKEIAEAAILSFPISHPSQPDTILGILNVSSDLSSSRLVDITEDLVVSEFRHGVSEACFDAIEELP
jgi:hypothetical protein